MKTILCALLLATPVLASQVDVDEGSVYADRPVHLTLKQGTFSVVSDDEKFDIPSYNIRGSVKGLSDEAVKSLLSSNDIYFRLNYEAKVLDSNLRMRGGMPPKTNTQQAQGHSDDCVKAQKEGKSGQAIVSGLKAQDALLASLDEKPKKK